MATGTVQPDFLFFSFGVLFVAFITAPSTDTKTRCVNSCETYLHSKDLTCEEGVAGHWLFGK